MHMKEHRNDELRKINLRQQYIKTYFYQSDSFKYFQNGHLVLLWTKAKEKPSLHMKFEELWIPPLYD